ncbi:hypothetical protein ACA910_017555 [Epithemia clementina (nom. ined.)]
MLVWVSALASLYRQRVQQASDFGHYHHDVNTLAEQNHVAQGLGKAQFLGDEEEGGIGNVTLGQRPLRELLWNAGYSFETNGSDAGGATSLLQQLNQLPTWEYLVQEYGEQPRIIGLETCAQFRNQPYPTEHMVSVAGTFNSGTNLLAQLLWDNCYMVARVRKYGPTTRGMRWQVPYGKHTPVYNETVRQLHRANNEHDIETDNVLPVVTIRDPYYWMTSMCRHKYEMSWPHNPYRCPNLVPSADDPPILQHISSIPVVVDYGDGMQRIHESLVHHYNEFYGAYLNATWPRIMVRYEDLIFRPRQVIEQVCTCAGGKLVGSGASVIEEYEMSHGRTRRSNAARLDGKKQASEPFHYVKESAKDNSPIHGRHRTGLLEAMLQYSHGRPRNMGNMTREDLAFAQKHLDPNILGLFHYQTISP